MTTLEPVENKAGIRLFERMLIESQSNCNRSCWFCPRTYDRSGKYLDEVGKPVLNQMPTEKILDLLDQAQVLGFGGGGVSPLFGAVARQAQRHARRRSEEAGHEARPAHKRGRAETR